MKKKASSDRRKRPSQQTKKNPKKQNGISSKVSKQEKKFHRKVKFNLPLSKNPYKTKQEKYQGKNERNPFKDPSSTDDVTEEDDAILPLDMEDMLDGSDHDDKTEQNGENKIISEDEGFMTTDDEDDAEMYERRPRLSFGANNNNSDIVMRQLLPLKTNQGKFITQSVSLTSTSPVDDSEKETEKSSDDEALVPEQKEQQKPPLSLVELLAEREKKLNECKQIIVHLCDLIMKNPYEEISKLKQLRLLLNNGDPLISITIRKLTMLSLVELFKDIVPGYRIKSLKENIKDENEKIKSKKKDTTKGESLSKDVKQIRNFEQTLLKNYQQFLHFLEQCAKKNLAKKNKKQQDKIKDEEMKEEEEDKNEKNEYRKSKLSVGHLAVQCLCKLLSNLSHFNFRSNLLNVTIQLMSNSDKEVVQMCCSCVSELLVSDKTGELSLETVRFMTKMLKTQSYAVHSCVLDVFLSLNIKEISEDEKEVKPKYRDQKHSRRDRKRHKETEELNKQLEEKTLPVRQQQRLKLNRQIIELLFLNYFRLLKRRLNLKLMSSVCEGLAKYSNLINIEYMDDLITCFYDLIQIENVLNRRAKFHCLITVFSILNKQAVLINIDPQRFYTVFYSLLTSTSSTSNNDDIDLIIHLIRLMLIDRWKQLSKPKLLAFIKRLTTMCLHLTCSYSISAIFEMIKALLTVSPQTTDMLYENELTGSGVHYLAEVNDPEYCHAQNSALYELYLINKFYDTNTRHQCEQLIKTKFNDPNIMKMCDTTAYGYLDKKQKVLSSIIRS
ncbi:unnamed protein product [Didymodactylos carnosus]|uniref:NOC3-like protein n=1 Tax=Didymodactylos carnosus TaxID=1234261 RepID=A0A814HRC5_9BILA|nr:unnamed protein product [Didymodactylos carnosus]CAF3785359.1 unnamed protein product [Didymodactylos carnosus]